MSKQAGDRASIVEDVLLGRASSGDIEAIKAVADLTASLCDRETEAAVDAGVFVFFKVKREGGNFQIFHKRLTVRERGLLNDKPTLLSDPYSLLEKFEDATPMSLEINQRLRQQRSVQIPSVN